MTTTSIPLAPPAVPRTSVGWRAVGMVSLLSDEDGEGTDSRATR